MLLGLVHYIPELLIDVWEFLLHVLDGEWCSNPGHDILALGIHQVFTIELILTIGRVAAESHTRSRITSSIAEYHGLDIDRCPKVMGYVIGLPVHPCTF